MFIPNIAGLSRGIMGNTQANRPQIGAMGQKSPMQDALGRLSNNLLQKQEQTALRDRVELKLSALSESPAADKSALPTGLLEVYVGMMRVSAQTAGATEQALTDFRDRLASFDKTIGEYEKMLRGETALPEEMTLEQVQTLLDLTRESRAKFLQDGADKVNELLSHTASLSQDGAIRNGVAAALGADGVPQLDAYAMHLDTGAEDIYAEIDRALEAVRGVSQTYRSAYASLAEEIQGRDDRTFNYSAYDLHNLPKSNMMHDLIEQSRNELRQQTRAVLAEREPVIRLGGN